MSYRSNYNVSPWQQRAPSYPMGGYSQNYNNYGGYGWGDNFPMSQMGRMAYEDMQPLHYQQKGRLGRNQITPRRKPMQGKRPPPRSPASGPPSKRPNYGDRPKRNRNDQRRRYSRSGAKKHGGKQLNDKDSRDESSESTYEDYECLDSDKEDLEVIEDTEEKMEVNGIDDEKQTVKVEEDKQNAKVEDKQNTKAGDKKMDIDRKEEKKTTFACHLCKIMSSTSEKYELHINTEDHRTKVDAALTLYREKKQPNEADSKDNKNQKKNVGKSDNWCTLCEVAFNGSFLSHRSSNEHKKQRDRKYPRCRPCSKGFSSPDEYWDHCKSEEHKKTSAEFYYLKKLVVGSDDDEAAIEPMPVEVKQDTTETDKDKEVKEDKVETEDSEEKSKEVEDKAENKNSEDSKEKKTTPKKSESEKSSKATEPEAKGTSFVIEVDGFYCKLCRKFFRDANVAKRKHCYSVMHYEAYKKAMESAFKDEEERQKLAEDNHKAELEAAELARRAADIAIIQKEARLAAKREAAEKKKAAQAALEIESQKAIEEAKKPNEEAKKSSEETKAEEPETEKTTVEEQPKKDSSGPEKQESSDVEKSLT